VQTTEEGKKLEKAYNHEVAEKEVLGPQLKNKTQSELWMHPGKILDCHW